MRTVLLLASALAVAACDVPPGSPDSAAPIEGAGASSSDTDPPAVPSGVDADAVPTEVTSYSCDACGGACKLDNVSCAARYHTWDDVHYTDPPPTCGPHNYCPIPAGVYDEELPDERWVHSLEHGFVVLLYDCKDGCDDEVALMTAFEQTHDDVVVVPYSGMTSRFAVLAWRWRMTTDCWSPDDAEAFYWLHHAQGPEEPDTRMPDDPRCDVP